MTARAARCGKVVLRGAPPVRALCRGPMRAVMEVLGVGRCGKSIGCRTRKHGFAPRLMLLKEQPAASVASRAKVQDVLLVSYRW